MIRIYHLLTYDFWTLFWSRAIEVHIWHPHARIVHAPNPSNSRDTYDHWLMTFSCQLIIAGVWHDFALPEILWAHHIIVHMRRSLFSWIICSIKSRSMLSLALTNDAIRLLILYHLLGHMTFISHYIDDDDVIARTCCNMSNVCLITLNLIKSSVLAKLQTSHFCCIKLHWWYHRETHQITNTMR